MTTPKNVVIPLDPTYLDQEAKRFSVSRTRLVKIVMDAVIREELVPQILGEPRDLSVPRAPHYRRFARPTS